MKKYVRISKSNDRSNLWLNIFIKIGEKYVRVAKYFTKKSQIRATEIRTIQNQYSNAAIVKEINVLEDKLSISDPK